MIVFHTNIKRKQNGYTLIELLLVVTVIAVIAALGIKTYRDKAESDRINIAALNVQHVLESAMSYNVAHTGLWPQNNWTSTTTPCATGAAVQDQDFLKSYLPNESNQSNFGAPLCWSGDDATLGPQKATRFWVAFSVGNDEAAVQTAQRIAARLPNAIITNDPSQESSTTTNTCTLGSACYIKAVVTVPSASTTTPPQSYISAVGLCDPGQGQTGSAGSSENSLCKKTRLADQFPGITAYQTDDSLSQYEIDFDCKPTEVGAIYVTPSFLRVDRSSTSTSAPFYDLTLVSSSCTDPNSDGKQKCIATLKADSGGEDNGSGKYPPNAVGCQNKYLSLTSAGQPICTCKSNASNTCGDQYGAVGGSYIAVCSLPTASQGLTQVSEKQNW